MEPSGKLRIAAPEDFGVTVLPGAITSNAATYVKVQIEAGLDSRPVDVVREGFDMAVRAHREPLKDSSMQIRRLAPIHFGFFASPACVERRGVPKRPHRSPRSRLRRRARGRHGSPPSRS
jgi:DNA-binding transcriptional LysR family regulator